MVILILSFEKNDYNKYHTITKIYLNE